METFQQDVPSLSEAINALLLSIQSLQGITQHGSASPQTFTSTLAAVHLPTRIYTPTSTFYSIPTLVLAKVTSIVVELNSNLTLTPYPAFGHIMAAEESNQLQCSAWRCWPSSEIAGVTAAIILFILGIGGLIWWFLDFPGLKKKPASLTENPFTKKGRLLLFNLLGQLLLFWLRHIERTCLSECSVWVRPTVIESDTKSWGFLTRVLLASLYQVFLNLYTWLLLFLQRDSYEETTEEWELRQQSKINSQPRREEAEERRRKGDKLDVYGSLKGRPKGSLAKRRDPPMQLSEGSNSFFSEYPESLSARGHLTNMRIENQNDKGRYGHILSKSESSPRSKRDPRALHGEQKLRKSHR